MSPAHLDQLSRWRSHRFAQETSDETDYRTTRRLRPRRLPVLPRPVQRRGDESHARRRARALQPTRGLQRAREGLATRCAPTSPRTWYSEPFARLARHPRMVEPVQDLFGEALYMHQFKINGKMAFEGDVWQWHQDYGTWKNDDLMPTERAMNVAIFLDDVNEFNGPLMFIPGSHKKGVIDAKHDLTTTSYPLWTVDNDTDRAAGGARRRQERRHRQPQGPGGLDDPVPLLPGARLDQQPVAVEPRQRLPEPVRRQQPHPPLQAARVHRPPRLHADRVPARRLPAGRLPGRGAVEERHAGECVGDLLRTVRHRAKAA